MWPTGEITVFESVHDWTFCGIELQEGFIAVVKLEIMIFCRGGAGREMRGDL